MKQHETHRLPKGAFCNTSVAPQRPPYLPRERHRVGEEELPPPRYRIPLTSTPEPSADEPACEPNKKTAP